jgi:hypothetical protein
MLHVRIRMPGEVILERHRGDRISALLSESATLLKLLISSGSATGPRFAE